MKTGILKVPVLGWVHSDDAPDWWRDVGPALVPAVHVAARSKRRSFGARGLAAGASSEHTTHSHARSGRRDV